MKSDYLKIKHHIELKYYGEGAAHYRDKVLPMPRIKRVRTGLERFKQRYAPTEARAY